MDPDMLTMGGIAATRRIAAEDPALAVVMLTVAGLERDAIEAVRAGAVGFLSKSLSPTAIIRPQPHRSGGSLSQRRSLRLLVERTGPFDRH
jgi:DNA-binding NarL/FixJ family response regulator